MANGPPSKMSSESKASDRQHQNVKFARRTSSGRIVSLSRDDDIESTQENDYINYTVMLPPTPDNQPGSARDKPDGPGPYGSTSRFGAEAQRGEGESVGSGRGVGNASGKVDRRMSLMKNNNKSMLLRSQTQDWDHNRWLFETKGRYGIGNAYWQNDENSYDDTGVTMSDFMDKPWKPLTRKVKIPGGVISPYRLLIVVRLVVLIFFLVWRIQNPNPEAMWLWGLSVVCECWFAFSWLLDILPKFNPIHRQTDLGALKEKFETPSPSNPLGRSDLPGIDLFVSTADPRKNPLWSLLTPSFPSSPLITQSRRSLATYPTMVPLSSPLRPWPRLSNLPRSLLTIPK
ncbi:unnamed protein product, partial [Thlaspi arvense]